MPVGHIWHLWRLRLRRSCGRVYRKKPKLCLVPGGQVSGALATNDEKRRILCSNSQGLINLLTALAFIPTATAMNRSHLTLR